MRPSASYPWSASRSRAAWSPPLHAFNKPVTSTDRVGTVAVLQKKIPRPWPLFPFASACSGEGGRGHENHLRSDGGDSWENCVGRSSSGGRTAGNGLHGQQGGDRVEDAGQGGFVR